MANNSKQVMDMQPSKGITTAQSDEHERRWTEKGWQHAVSKGNYDPTRERLNFEITKGGMIRPVDKSMSIPERMAANLRERGIKDPNEELAQPRFRTVVNFIFGGSRDRMRELAFGKQDVDFEPGADNSSVSREKDIEQWAKDIYTFVCGKYGEENIAAFIVHLDETNPHVHCTMLPIVDGRFSFQKVMVGKDKYEFKERMTNLHSDIAEINAKWGLARGTNISETGARHRSTEQYRRELSEQCTRLEQTIVQQKNKLTELRSDIKLAERRLKGLTSMVDHLKRDREEAQVELDKIRQALLNGDSNAGWLAEQKENLEKKLADIQTQLAEKEGRRAIAEQQLQQLQRQLVSTQEQTEMLRTEARQYSQVIHSRVDNVIKDIMVDELTKEHVGRLATMPEEMHEIFDDSLLQSLSERGSEVLHCTKLLAVGLLNDATTFAEGHGGGGGGPKGKWGKDDDEDYRDWMRRCMLMAAHMMRPKSGRKPKR